ncbi:hypothetical protein BREVNS_2265 [Brevinematales bacterium NS]|nr:hypothetical protein BREVNS_2265 [Brevinematales bacterium NS]
MKQMVLGCIFVPSFLFATSLSHLLFVLSTNNPSLLQLKSEQKAALAQSEASVASLWQPSFRLSTGIALSEEASPSPTASLSVSKSLNLGGKEWLSLQQNFLQNDLFKKKEIILKASLKKSLFSTYFSHLKLLAEVEAAERNYELASKKTEQFLLQYEMGKITLSTLQEQQTKAYESYLSWQNKKQSLEENQNTLSSLLGNAQFSPSPSEEELRYYLSSLDISSSPPFLERDENYLSLLFSLSNTLLASKIQQASSYPDIGISAGYQIGMKKNGLSGQWNAGVSLSMDPFSWLPGSSSFYEQKKTQENLASLRSQIEARQKTVENSLRLLRTQESIAQQTLTFAELSFQAVSNQLEKAKEQYALGRISALDLLSVEASYLSTKASLISAMVNLLTIRCELAFWYNPDWPEFFQENK